MKKRIIGLGKEALLAGIDASGHLKRRLRNTSFMRALLYERSSKDVYGDHRIHEVMLSDKVRLDTYHKAIMKHVKEGDTVLDVGTGTGILAFFAAQKNPRRVYAIDHSKIVETAKLLADDNGVENVVFERVSSKEFSVREKVDVIIHEQIGYCLFDEHIVDLIGDLRDRLLAKNGKILPGRFELYIEPMSLKEEYRVPFLWEMDVHGVRYDSLRKGNGDRLAYESKEFMPLHYLRELYPFEVDCLLCEPEKVMELDLHSATEADVPKRLRYRKTVSKDSQMDVIGIYFRAIFDEDIAFDNSPLSPRTHFHMKAIRAEAMQCKEGDVLEFEWDIEDIARIATWTCAYRKVVG